MGKALDVERKESSAMGRQLIFIGCKETKVIGEKWKAPSKMYMLPKLLKLSQVFIP